MICFFRTQWNCLADGLAQAGDFVRAPPAVLSWEARAPLVLAELSEADADLLCLQEVNHYGVSPSTFQVLCPACARRRQCALS